MTTPFNPQSLTRPDHPDFWKMSRMAMANDDRMDAAPSPEEDSAERERIFLEIVASFADPQSVFYMGMQRSMRMLGVETMVDLIDAMPEVIKMQAIWLDAFLVGVGFAREEETTTP